jgi:hypothetical protein
MKQPQVLLAFLVTIILQSGNLKRLMPLHVCSPPFHVFLAFSPSMGIISTWTSASLIAKHISCYPIECVYIYGGFFFNEPFVLLQMWELGHKFAFCISYLLLCQIKHMLSNRKPDYT